MKYYTLSALLLVSAVAHAAEVDCKSAEYSYSPTVQKACEDMQKTNLEAKEQGEKRFSELLKEKKAALQARSKEIMQTYDEATSPGGNSSTPNQNTATQAPTSAVQHPAQAQSAGSAPAANAAPVATTQAHDAMMAAIQPQIHPSITAPAQIPVARAGDAPNPSTNQPSAPQPAPTPSVNYY